jgi:hypothetical protein
MDDIAARGSGEPDNEMKAGHKRCHLDKSRGFLRSWNDPVEEVLQAFREARGERWWE